jgi:single-strand DNA-binding protein
MNETFVTMSGYVATDPQVRLTKGQVPFVTFRLASTPRRVDVKTGEYVDGGTNFVNVTAFRGLGVNVAGSVKKGQPVMVYGRMRVNQWTGADGRPGTSVEVEAYNIGFDMAKGRSTFERVLKPQLDPGDRLADPAVQAAHGAGTSGDSGAGDAPGETGHVAGGYDPGVVAAEVGGAERGLVGAGARTD